MQQQQELDDIECQGLRRELKEVELAYAIDHDGHLKDLHRGKLNAERLETDRRDHLITTELSIPHATCERYDGRGGYSWAGTEAKLSELSEYYNQMMQDFEDVLKSEAESLNEAAAKRVELESLPAEYEVKILELEDRASSGKEKYEAEIKLILESHLSRKEDIAEKYKLEVASKSFENKHRKAIQELEKSLLEDAKANWEAENVEQEKRHQDDLEAFKQEMKKIERKRREALAVMSEAHHEALVIEDQEDEELEHEFSDKTLFGKLDEQANKEKKKIKQQTQKAMGLKALKARELKRQNGGK